MNIINNIMGGYYCYGVLALNAKAAQSLAPDTVTTIEWVDPTYNDAGMFDFDTSTSNIILPNKTDLFSINYQVGIVPFADIVDAKCFLRTIGEHFPPCLPRGNKTGITTTTPYVYLGGAAGPLGIYTDADDRLFRLRVQLGASSSAATLDHQQSYLNVQLFTKR